MRSESSSSAEAERAREAQRPESAPRGKSRTVVSPEDAKRFRTLLDAGRQRAAPLPAATDITAPVSGLDEPMKFVEKDADMTMPADVSSMLHAQRVLLEAPA